MKVISTSIRAILPTILAAMLFATSANAASWDLSLFQKESTLQFYTVNASGEEHWSTVWVVVIDGAPYLRLGSASTDRINGNTKTPYVNIRIGGQEFDHVTAQSAPEMRDKVMAAMRDKYWMDFTVRYSNHPLIMRLVQPAAPQP
jgi:hypothetical protein